MSDDAGNDPFGANNPFQNLPIFGDLAKMFQNQGPMSWDAARQFALSIATGGQPEANVDPLERIKIEQLARVAELHVGTATGLPASAGGAGITIEPVTRSRWADATLDAWRPLFEALARSLHAPDQPPPPHDEPPPDPESKPPRMPPSRAPSKPPPPPPVGRLSNAATSLRASSSAAEPSASACCAAASAPTGSVPPSASACVS